MMSVKIQEVLIVGAINQVKGATSSNKSQAPTIVLCAMAALSEESTVLLKLCDVSMTEN
jgi:hypothetical protein